jgi:acetylornithine deacetylase/succinyl-diaminopimelate desuccinylase-like protein
VRSVTLPGYDSRVTAFRGRHRAIVLALMIGLAGAWPAAQPASPRRVIETWVDAHQAALVSELVELLRIPNVAADRPNIRRNAEHLRGLLARHGFVAELLETAGNPLVYGERRIPGATRTLLFYAHYDGQPVDPRAWAQPDPFAPTLREGRHEDAARERALAGVTRFDPDWRLYARSASDDKSPIVALCAALDALTAAGRAPTANLRIILDGEEEAGSRSLIPAVARFRDKLSADLMIIIDGPTHSSGRPTVSYGARGIQPLELTVYGPKTGVHSGNYGNWVPNPALGLAHLLASMKDDKGRVLVEGFYDGIDPPGAEEQALMAAVPEDGPLMLRTFGVAGPEVAGRSLQASLQLPTLNIRGLASAHVGAAARTIIPDRAIAALDIRLVKETPADAMLAKLRRHIEGQGYTLVDADPDDAARAQHARLARLVAGPATNAFRTSPQSPEAQRLTAAIARMFGEPPVRIRTLGGTVPIAPFIETLGFPAVLVPTVNFDNNQHDVNENLRLGHFFTSIVTMSALLTM